MKNKASLLLLSLLLIVPSCNKNTDSSTSSETSEETKFEGTYVINDFENMDDLYRVKQLLHQISYRVDCELSIDNENVQNGNGSLHVTYNNNTYGQIYQRNALSPIKDAPMNDVANVSCWFYNDNDQDTTVDVNVVGKETEIISTLTAELPKKEWTLVSYDLNQIAMNAVKDDVRGFSFEFGQVNSYPSNFYADNFTVTFGNHETEDDSKYLKLIDQLIKDIDLLPDRVTMNDTENINLCKSIAERYSQIPGIYRPAVTNYDIFKLVLQTYIDSVADKTATDSDVIAYHFDTCFGLAQAGFSYVQTSFPLSYSKDMSYNGEEGSLKATFAGEKEWLNFNATSSVNMQNYDYIEFAIYNDTPADIAFCLSWDATHIAGKGGWQVFRVPTRSSTFMPSFIIEWDFTSCDPTFYGDSNAHPIYGDVYISQVTLHRASASKFIEMLDALPAVLTSEQEDLVSEIRTYYENLHKDEKAKISQADYARLLQAEHDVLVSNFASLSSMIDALPTKANIKAYNGTFIIKSYNIYSVMTSDDVARYLSVSQVNKIKELYQAYTSKYKEVINSSIFAGDNVGISWDVRANATKRLDNEYGNVCDFKISDMPLEGLNGAYEFQFKAIDTSSYKNVIFYVNPAHNDTLYVSRSSWRGGDSSRGYMLEQKLVAGIWNEIVIPGSSFVEACYIEFYFTDSVLPSVNDIYSFTSFYGELN